MFLNLSQQMMSKSDEKAKNTPGQSYSFGTSNRSGGITIQDDSVLESRKKSGCCGGGGGGEIVEGQPDPTSPH